MKRLAGLLLIVLAHTTKGQYVADALDSDPVFRYVAEHQIRYPVKSANRAVYGRFFAGFTIDSLGHIRDVSVLYPKMSLRVARQYGFTTEIMAGLNRMPPLPPKCAGTYVLPVAFCFVHYGEGPNPLIPQNQWPPAYDLGNRTMLNEVRVMAKSPSATRELNGFPPSRQIGQ